MTRQQYARLVETRMAAMRKYTFRLLALATSLGTLWTLAFAGGASFRGW